MNQDGEPSVNRGEEIARELRALNPPYYYSSLFVPRDKRAAVQAILAFASELDQIPDRVSEPALGEIRLAWWRDALDRAAYGAPPETEFIGAISETMSKYSLPWDALKSIIEARRLDLYSDPPPTRSDMEGYFGETVSIPLQLVAFILDPDREGASVAAGHAGISLGLTRRIAHLSRDRSRGRIIAPEELLNQHELTKDQMLGQLSRPSSEYQDLENRMMGLVESLINLAKEHLEESEIAIAECATQIQLAFLPIAIVPALLRRAEQAGSTILRRPVGLSNLASLSHITWRAIRR